jgi:NAD+ kinase
MKAAIYSQKKDLDTFLYLSKFISELESRGVKSVLYDEMAEALQFSKFSKPSIPNRIFWRKKWIFFHLRRRRNDCKFINFIEDLEIPVVGVNTGRLGFLASFTKEEAFRT